MERMKQNASVEWIMSDKLREQLTRFRNHVFIARKQWSVYQLLREVPPAGLGVKVEIFSLNAPELYDASIRGLVDSTFMQLARLGDPAKDKRGNKSLTIERIWQECNLKPENSRVKSAETAMQEARDHLGGSDFKSFRDQFMAHNDMKSHGKPGISYSVIAEAVNLVWVFQKRLDEALGQYDQLKLETIQSLEYDEKIKSCREELEHLLRLIADGGS